MPKFPKKEAEIAALANHLSIGLRDNRTIYPQPPVHPLRLHIRRMIYLNHQDNFLAKQAAAETTITAKNEALEDLVEAVKANIRYAENTVNYDDNKLKLIGWAGRKKGSVLQTPGQARLLEAPRQGDGWVFLDWKAPAEGGKPRAYTIQRRNRDDGSWKNIATALLTEATLVEQPQKAELEYRIIAINKSGHGQPSNTVTAVL